MKRSTHAVRRFVARFVVAVALVAVAVIAQFSSTGPRIASAAVTNSYSTLGTVSYDAGSCGVDSTAGVVTSPGIKRMVKVSNNEIYVVGCFLNFAGDANADYVAKWNGSAWSGLGSSGDINAIVHDAVIYKGSLHIAGEFENAGGDATADMVAKWNGTAWVGLPVQGATGGANGTGSPRDAASAATDYATALEVQENGAGTSDDVLLVGGRFIYGINDGTGPGFTIANTRNIATWNGSAWAAVTSSNPYPGTTETDMAVRDIVSIGSDIYLGAYRNNSTYVSSRRTYMFLRYRNSTGTWDRPVSTVSQQFNGTGFGVYTMTASGTDIYVGGTFSGLSSVASDFAVYSTTSNTFADYNGFAASYGTGAVVRSISVAGSQVFVGGSFPGVTGTSGGVARWTGASWQGIGRNAPSVVNSVLADMAYSGSDSRMFVASSGTDIGGVAAADGLATLALDSSSSLDSMSVSVGTLSPAFNPGTTSYTLSIPNASSTVDFTVLASSSGAAIKRTNSTGTIALSSDTDTLSVAVGATENITFTAAALSGTGTTAYTVAVTRAAASQSSSSSSSSTTIASSTSSTSTSSTVAPSSSTTVAPATNTGASSTVSNVVKHGATASKTTLLKLAKTTVPSGGKYALKIASAYAKVCKVSGTGVKTLKAGTCKVTITITPKTGRASTKTVTLKVS